ncbi:MAG: hypothetical protein HYX57_08775 [Chloroflexi bacterium]|nr:hypothetical protein [Chloroflexota bacterium]
MRGTRGRDIRGLLTGLAVAMLAAGCLASRVAAPPTDDLSAWSATPLAPDADLAAKAADANGSCTAGPGGGPVRIILQDRRTERTAGFLFLGASTFGSCFVTASGNSSGGSGPLPDPMTAAVSIDTGGFGDVADGQARSIGGRGQAGVNGVLVGLADGRVVTATVAEGYWLAWWPNDVKATIVTGIDAAGQPVARLSVP